MYNRQQFLTTMKKEQLFKHYKVTDLYICKLYKNSSFKNDIMHLKIQVKAIFINNTNY
jgi:hypothetical protein